MFDIIEKATTSLEKVQRQLLQKCSKEILCTEERAEDIMNEIGEIILGEYQVYSSDGHPTLYQVIVGTSMVEKSNGYNVNPSLYCQIHDTSNNSSKLEGSVEFDVNRLDEMMTLYKMTLMLSARSTFYRYYQNVKSIGNTVRLTN